MTGEPPQDLGPRPDARSGCAGPTRRSMSSRVTVVLTEGCSRASQHLPRTQQCLCLAPGPPQGPLPSVRLLPAQGQSRAHDPSNRWSRRSQTRSARDPSRHRQARETRNHPRAEKQGQTSEPVFMSWQLGATWKKSHVIVEKNSGSFLLNHNHPLRRVCVWRLTASQIPWAPPRPLCCSSHGRPAYRTWHPAIPSTWSTWGATARTPEKEAHSGHFSAVSPKSRHEGVCPCDAVRWRTDSPQLSFPQKPGLCTSCRHVAGLVWDPEALAEACAGRPWTTRPAVFST